MTIARKFAEELHQHWVSSDEGPVDGQGVSLKERELRTGERIIQQAIDAALAADLAGDGGEEGDAT